MKNICVYNVAICTRVKKARGGQQILKCDVKVGVDSSRVQLKTCLTFIEHPREFMYLYYIQINVHTCLCIWSILIYTYIKIIRVHVCTSVVCMQLVLWVDWENTYIYEKSAKGFVGLLVENIGAQKGRMLVVGFLTECIYPEDIVRAHCATHFPCKL